jgi:hypothetical protein
VSPVSSTHVQDFDAAAGEHDPIPFRLLGRDWEVPGTCPARVLLLLDRAMVALGQLEQTGAVPDDLVLDSSWTPEGMLRAMVGNDLVDEWLALDITYPQLRDVARFLSGRYRGEADGQGEAAPPNRAAKRAAAKTKTAKRSSASRGTTSSKGGRR